MSELTTIQPGDNKAEPGNGKYTVLLADDQPTNLSTIANILQNDGMTVLFARDGESCLKQALYTQPDLILLDAMMPGIDGFETCRRLKADNKTRDIPVLFMTVLTDTEDKVKGFDAGAVDYVTKPVDARELLARVTTHLSLSDMHKQVIKSRDKLENRVRERTKELLLVNETIVKSEENLKVALEEKNALLRELYHRTGNSMQLIISMLNMTAFSIDDERVLETFDNINERISSMILVHEKLYRSGNLSSINLKEYIIELCSSREDIYIGANFNISFNFDLEDVSVLIDVAVPLGLIITELISNSFKHAFLSMNKGEISVRLTKQGESIVRLEFGDNGIGADSVFSIDKLETIGLQTVFALGKDQLHGNIELDTSSGFKFILTFNNDVFKTRV